MSSERGWLNGCKPSNSPRGTMEWLFDNEERLPTRITPLLECIASEWARRMEVSSACHGRHTEFFWSHLFEQIHNAAEQANNLFYFQENGRLVNRTIPPKSGWYLEHIDHLENSHRMHGGKFLFSYASPVTGKRHHMMWTKRGIGVYTAHFRLCDNSLFFCQYKDENETRTCFVNDSKWHVEQGAGFAASPATRPFVVEAVRPGCGGFVYGRFDTSYEVASIKRVDTRMKRIDVGFKTFSHFAEYARPFVGLQMASLNRMVYFHGSDLLDGKHADSTLCINRTHQSLSTLLVCDQVPRFKMYCELSWLYTKRLQDRVYRMGYKLLLTKAEQAEERRARDPVRKCAACAVQAAKSQLVLGIEPAAKRLCV